jgi:hypothetical protein
MSLVDKGIEEHFAGSHSVRTRCCCFVALRHTVIGVRPFHNREATTMKRDEINSATQLAGRIAAPLLALVILAAGCSSAHASTASTNRAGSSAASAPPTAEPGTPAKPVAAKGRVIQLDGQSLTIADIIDIANAKARVEFALDGIDRINAAREVVDHYIAAKLPAYGITTM